MQEDIDHDAQTPTLSASEQAHWSARLWTFCQGCGSQEQSEDQCPPYVIQCVPLDKFQRAVRKGDLSTVEHFTTYRAYNVDEDDRSKGTSTKEPEQRTKKHVRFNREVHLSTDPKPFCSEVRTPGELQSILKKPVQSSTVNAGTKQDAGTSISEAIPLKQMKSINETKSAEISEELNNNIEQKSLSRLSDKPDPDVPGTTIEDNDCTYVIKKICKDAEMSINDIDYIHEETSSQFLHQSKQARRCVKNIQKLLGRCEVVCSQGEPLDNTSEEQIPTKKVTQDQEKTECDSEYETVRLQPPSEDSNEEKWVRLVATQYSFLNQYLRERLKEKMKEGIEHSESDTSDEEPLPSTSGGRAHSMQKMSSKQEYTSTQSEHLSAKKSEEEMWAQMSAHQYACLNELLRKDFKKKIRKMYEKSESNICSKRVPSPNKPKEKTYLKQKMTEEKKKHGGKDARVHSRLPLLRRTEDVKEQAVWHHTHMNELLRNDIKELVKEQLATGHARMRKLLRKDLEEIKGLLKKELRQILMEKMVLLQEQVKETQQEHWSPQYLQLKELFRRDLKEMVRDQVKYSKIIIRPKEEPLPGASGGTADFQRTSLEQRKKKKYEGDHDSGPSPSEKPPVQTEEGVTDAQSDSCCMPLKELIKEDLKEELCEILEKYKYDTYMNEEPPHILKGRKLLREISTGQELRKKYDSESLYSEQLATKTVKEVEHEHNELQYMHLKELIKKDLKVKICDVLGKYENVCLKEEGLPHVSKRKTRLKKITEEQEMEKSNVERASLWPWPSVKTDEVTIDRQSVLQYKHLKKYIRENVKEMVHEQLENAELIIHPNEEPPPDDSRREISTKVKEKKPGYLHVPHFNSFEHRIAALRDTAHVEPAPAAGDMVDMDKAFKAELARPLALAVSTEHQRWQPHTDPELAPDHRTGDTRDPPHNADLALDKLSIDPESAPLCGPSDTKDPANDADLAFPLHIQLATSDQA